MLRLKKPQIITLPFADLNQNDGFFIFGQAIDSYNQSIRQQMQDRTNCCCLQLISYVVTWRRFCKSKLEKLLSSVKEVLKSYCQRCVEPNTRRHWKSRNTYFSWLQNQEQDQRYVKLCIRVESWHFCLHVELNTGAFSAKTYTCPSPIPLLDENTKPVCKLPFYFHMYKGTDDLIARGRFVEWTSKGKINAQYCPGLRHN